MELPKRRLLLNAFFKAQFNCCPVVCMFHSRSLNNKINRLHERCLRIIYNNKHSNFDVLLEKDNSVSIHHNNIHSYAIKMYKVANGMSPEIMKDVFQIRNISHYNLRYAPTFLLKIFIVSIMVVSQHRICDPKYGNKYLLKSKR